MTPGRRATRRRPVWTSTGSRSAPARRWCAPAGRPTRSSLRSFGTAAAKTSTTPPSSPTPPDGPVVIEMAPVPDGRGRHDRGVVAEGPVGARWLGRFRTFRYEIRRWSGGLIPDLATAVSSPVRITDDPDVVQRVLDLVPFVPTPVWGRDEAQTGDMWNSNSVVAWLLERAGVEPAAGPAPDHGRAPGWAAGVAAAHDGRGGRHSSRGPDLGERACHRVGMKPEHPLRPGGCQTPFVTNRRTGRAGAEHR